MGENEAKGYAIKIYNALAKKTLERLEKEKTTRLSRKTERMVVLTERMLLALDKTYQI